MLSYALAVSSFMCKPTLLFTMGSVNLENSLMSKSNVFLNRAVSNKGPLHGRNDVNNNKVNSIPLKDGGGLKKLTAFMNYLFIMYIIFLCLGRGDAILVYVAIFLAFNESTRPFLEGIIFFK